MLIETLIVGVLEVNCYVVGCEVTHQAAVIDPGDEASEILAALRRHGLTLACILATHAHFDHVMAARSLAEATAAPFWVHPAERPGLAMARRMAMAWLGQDPGEMARVDGELAAGQAIWFGQESLEVRLTPGHSPGGVTFVHHASRHVFSGDALFAGSIGRTDLPGGDIRTLLASIRSQILTLPDDYVVLPGHGPASTVGEERQTNPFLRS